MEIKDNQFSRQFEITVDGKLVSIEYSFQEKKLFLTKIHTPDGFEDEETISDFLKAIMAFAEEKRYKVMPTHPKVVAFFKKNSVYKELLPPGIRL
ncbi:hypothetical protein D3C87_244860 [compost metagenome]